MSLDALKRLTLRAVLLSTAPLLGVIIWLVLLREPGIQAETIATLSRSAAELRASALASRLQLAQQSVGQLASKLSTIVTAEQTPVQIPDNGIIMAALAIPLGERGTVDLVPGQNGLQSHIEVDLIRRAFVGEEPPPDIIPDDKHPRLVIARPIGQPPVGVVLADISPSLIAPLLTTSSEGEYWIEQSTGANMTARVLMGRGGVQQDLRVPIEGSRWQLGLTADPQWLSPALPSVWALWIALGAVCLGAVLSAMMLLRGFPALLSRDVKALEAMTLSGEMPNLALDELRPLAKTLRQLSEFGRSRVTASRQHLPSAPPAATATTTISIKDPSPAFSPPVAAVEELSHTIRRQNPLDDPDFSPENLWHPCGYRGDTRSELDNHVAERMGAALAVLARDRRVETLLVATDGRPSSAHLRSALVKALVAGGCNVIDGGAAPTPALCHALATSDTRSGIMVTGGHNPEPINGFKIYLDGQPIAAAELATLRRFYEENRRTSGQGRVAKRDLVGDYNNAIALDVALALPLKVVVDCGFGSVSEAAPALLAALDCQVVVINPWGDPQSKNHRSTDQALHALGRHVVTERADLGVLFDRDGDRLHVVTESGKPVSTAQLLALLSQSILSRHPGAPVVQDVALGPFLSSVIQKHSGTVSLTSGCATELTQAVKTQLAVIGGSAYGHLIITERWHNFPDAIYACSRLLEVLAGAGATLTTMSEQALAETPTEWRFIPNSEKDTRECLELAAALAPANFKLLHTPGLRFDGDNGWFLLRAHPDRTGLEFVLGADDTDNLVSINATAIELLAKAAPDLALSLDQP